ncbi:universal stress protein (plasmid) [Ensifer sp. PDNC004]|uniref:universal stress protein n=1 Tax=unclassified Ensifer TaxID=2633371 RepID=UPI001785FE04|nr:MULTISPECIES: universal stress protein [unclassified Ensifer]MBD9649907.1 universal stress protein [Ensifer sp. ENS09]QRY70516.1 universal stress protein [Ensifer sp. PDNC004]
MTYKTVLLVVDADNYDLDLRTAADLCMAGSAHLSVLLVRLAAPVPLGDYAAMSVAWLDVRAQDAEKLGDAVTNSRATLEGLGISFEVEGCYPEEAWVEDDIGERARYADMTLIGSSLEASSRLRSHAIEGALFRSAHPVLLSGNRQSVTLAPKKILLAWNSTIEAARAAREALEMMKAADSVNVVLVDPTAAPARNGEEPGADVATYLARHGIRVTVDRLPSSGRQIHEVLMQHALDTSVDLIVMGAYGHSRVRERMFGGVTKAMIEAPAVPVLMVH